MSDPDDRVAELLAKFDGSARPAADLLCDGHDRAGAFSIDKRDAVHD